MKKVIRLTESQLQSIINESVKRVLISEGVELNEDWKSGLKKAGLGALGLGMLYGVATHDGNVEEPNQTEKEEFIHNMTNQGIIDGLINQFDEMYGSKYDFRRLINIACDKGLDNKFIVYSADYEDTESIGRLIQYYNENKKDCIVVEIVNSTYQSRIYLLRKSMIPQLSDRH